MKNYFIRVGTEQDIEGIIAVRRDGFFAFETNEETFQQNMNIHLFPLVQAGKTRVVVQSEQIIGWGSFSLLKDNSQAMEDMKFTFQYLADPNQREYTLSLLQKQHNQIGRGQVRLAYFDYSPSLATYSGDDLWVVEIAVETKFRKQGFGSELVHSIMYSGREQGARRAYAFCMEGSGSRELFSRYGFEPIVCFGPAQKDGSAVLLMGVDLESKL